MRWTRAPLPGAKPTVINSPAATRIAQPHDKRTHEHKFSAGYCRGNAACKRSLCMLAD